MVVLIFWFHPLAGVDTKAFGIARTVPNQNGAAKPAVKLLLANDLRTSYESNFTAMQLISSPTYWGKH